MMIYVNARAIIERMILNHTEVVVQLRAKRGQERYEFPGGQVKPFESLFTALKREVKEETGLDIIEATGQDSLIETDETRSFQVECFRPYAVYQTLKGNVDSMGVYFKCKAVGTLLSVGDDSMDIKWISLDTLNDLLGEANSFSDIDRAAAEFYLNENNRQSNWEV